ncbi:MAG: glycosyltransferase family 2 protein [Candidatus Omnitrophota bacterium]
MFDNGIVSVIVVDWRNSKLLRNCLVSIYHQTYSNFEIILIENEPVDSLLREIEKLFPQVKIIVNRKNFFYAHAQNQGIRESKGEFVLSLNNDIILDKNFIKEAIDTINIDKRIGIVAGRILSYEGKYIDSAGQLLTPMRKPLERGYKEKYVGQFDKAGFVFGACGACAFYKRIMLEEIKLKEGEYFDDSYGLFYEDLDLNWRANRQGWKAYYNPKMLAYHLRGHSVRLYQPKFRLFKRFEFCCLLPEHKLMLLRNRYATLIKNEKFKDFLRNLFFIFLYDLSLWGYLIIFEPITVIKFRKETRFLLNVFRERR